MCIRKWDSVIVFEHKNQQSCTTTALLMTPQSFGARCISHLLGSACWQCTFTQTWDGRIIQFFFIFFYFSQFFFCFDSKQGKKHNRTACRWWRIVLKSFGAVVFILIPFLCSEIEWNRIEKAIYFKNGISFMHSMASNRKTNKIINLFCVLWLYFIKTAQNYYYHC